MSLEVLDIVKRSLERTFSPTGLKLIGAFYLLSIVSGISGQSLLSSGLIPEAAMAQQTALPLAFTSVPVPALVGLAVVGTIANIVLTIGALRNIVGGKFEELDTSYFTENLALPALNIVAGSIVFGLIVGAGLIAFIIPGIILAVSLIFWQIFVVVEDENFIDALKMSWETTKGNRVDLFLLGVAALIVSFAAGIAVGIPAELVKVASPILGALLGTISGAFSTVFTLTALAHAYNELAE